MAIQFLNTIDLNNIPIEGFAVENLATDPIVSQEGSIYYNTANDIVKVYTGAGWVEVGGGVTELTVSSGTYVSLTDATSQTGAVDLGTVDLSAADGTSTTATRFLSKDNTWSVPSYTTITTTDGTYIDLTPDTAIGGAVTITADISAVNGTAAAGERYLTKNNTWAEVATIPGTYTFDVTADSGTNQTIESGNTLNIGGGTNISTVVGATDTVTVNLDDSITLAGELTVSGTGQSSFGGQVTIPATPSVGTDAASKSYVDASVVGNLVYQGGYNAATNTPDLITSPNSIEKGWTYTVTADGTFFGEQLRVGDVLIAELDGPSALADWTTVQNNIDLASLTTVGIGNVNAGTGISVAYNSGTATVTNTGALGDRVSLTGGSQAGGLTTFTYDVTNSFGAGTVALDVKCEVISSAGETVYAGVTRSGANLSVEFVGSISNGAYEVLLTHVG